MRVRIPSPSMIIAVIALVAALGGTSYAAVTIGSAQIKDNSVRGKDIRNNSLTGRDVKNDSLGGRDVKESALGKVPRASQADRVGGLDASRIKLRCPSGTRRTFGSCMDLAAKGPTTLTAAQKDCDSRGGRLPGIVELSYIRDLSGVTWANGQANQYEFSNDQTAGKPTAVDKAGNTFPDASAQTFWHRCLTQPVNG
jgi:hypothetical protein